MNTAFLFRPRVRQATTILLLLLAIGTMYAAHDPALKFWAAQAQWIALSYFLAGMTLFMFRRTRLMFVCLGCSAAISLFFSETHAGRMAKPPRDFEQFDSSNYELTAPNQ